MQQAQALAWNVHADITGGIAVKFRYQNLGEMLTMGRLLPFLPTPSTLNPAPSSLNPQPSTINPRPSPLTPQP